MKLDPKIEAAINLLPEKWKNKETAIHELPDGTLICANPKYGPMHFKDGKWSDLEFQEFSPPPEGRTVKCLHCREVVRAVKEVCPMCHKSTADFASFSVFED